MTEVGRPTGQARGPTGDIGDQAISPVGQIFFARVVDEKGLGWVKKRGCSGFQPGGLDGGPLIGIDRRGPKGLVGGLNPDVRLSDRDGGDFDVPISGQRCEVSDGPCFGVEVLEGVNGVGIRRSPFNVCFKQDPVLMGNQSLTIEFVPLIGVGFDDDRIGYSVPCDDRMLEGAVLLNPIQPTLVLRKVGEAEPKVFKSAIISTVWLWRFSPAAKAMRKRVLICLMIFTLLSVASGDGLSSVSRREVGFFSAGR